MKDNLYEAHSQWRSRPQDQRYESLQELIDAVKGRRMRSRSIDVEVEKLSAQTDGEALVFSSPTVVAEPTHYSFGQLSGLIKAPPGYLRTLPTDLAVLNLNHGIKEARGGKPVKLMS